MGAPARLMVRGFLVVGRWACHLGGSGLCSKLLLACAATISRLVHARLGDLCMTRGEFTALYLWRCAALEVPPSHRTASSSGSSATQEICRVRSTAPARLRVAPVRNSISPPPPPASRLFHCSPMQSNE